MESSKASSIAKLALIFLAMALFALWLAYDASAASYPSLNTSLEGYWCFTVNASDCHTSGNNGNPVGVTHVASGGANTGFYNWTGGEASGNRIEIDSTSLSGDKTVQYWFNTVPSSARTIFFFDSQNGRWVIEQASGTIQTFDGGWDDSGVMYSNNGTWQHVVITVNSAANTATVYINGTNVSTWATNDVGVSSPTNLGCEYDDSGKEYLGGMDEVAVWDRALNSTEVGWLYNDCFYPFDNCNPPVVTTDITFSAIDDFNSSSILNFSINVTWGHNGSTETYSTTNGSVSFTNVSDNSFNVNVTYWNAADYFDLTLLNEAITANTTNTVQASMYQAVANLTATEIQTNNSLSGVTFYIGSKSGTLFNLTAGTHTVIAERAGYYNLTGSITVAALSNTSYNLEGMYNSIANFSAYNALNNASISSFSIALSTGNNYSTTNGSVEVPILNNTDYSVNVSATNYTSVSNYNFTMNLSNYQNVSVPMYQFNSIRVNIFNESSMTALLQAVTVHTISNLTSFSNITSTGFINIALLYPNSYELRFESANMNPRSIFLTVTNDSTQNVSVYMTENTTTELQVVEVLDTSNTPVEGAVVWLQKQKINITGTRWVTIQEAQTDYDGKTSVYVERDTTVFYRFAVIYDGTARPIQPTDNLFTGPTSFVPGVTETIQLIVNLEEEPTDFISDDLAINWTVEWVNTTAINFTWLDGRNTITGARLLVEASYINETLAYETIANISLSGSFGFINYSIPVINNSVWRLTAFLTYETSTETVWQGIKRFDIDVIIEKNTGLLYAIIIILIVTFLSVEFGPLPSSLMAIGSILPLSYLKLISIPLTIITSLLALAVIFFFRTRKLDE